MPRPKDALADAHQRCRDLRNQLHASEEKLQPLREELRMAQVERDKAVVEASKLRRKTDALMQLVTSIIGVAHEISED